MAFHRAGRARNRTRPRSVVPREEKLNREGPAIRSSRGERRMEPTSGIEPLTC
jgi:hypothetical protein